MPVILTWYFLDRFQYIDVRSCACCRHKMNASKNSSSSISMEMTEKVRTGS